MPERTLRIRDPIYNYVTVTALERELLDHPVTQRLRHIAQSGLAQYVFPEVRTSRFSHSLGAMHLSSAFLAAALRNAPVQARDVLESGFREAVRHVDQFYAPDAETTERLTRARLLAGGFVSSNAAPYALVVEQGLRLAALFHDLGHLPFSHDFEYVLRDLGPLASQNPTLAPLFTRGKPPHERIGYALATLLQQTEYQRLTERPGGIATRVAFGLAQDILRADVRTTAGGPVNEREAALLWLHEIVAGELDVDRSDYLLRDARAYGFGFVSFDLDRLLDHLVAVKPDPHAHAIRMAVLPQGQAAAESFLVARFRMYQWGVFHHKVQQAAAALRHTTRRLLVPALTADPRHDPLARLLDDLARVAGSEDDPRLVDGQVDAILRRFTGYDDVWWLGQLRDLDRREADAWSGLVIRRERGVRSLWKRVTDFPGGPEILANWNSRLPERSDLAAVASWEAATRDLQTQDVLVARHHFDPWEPLDEADPVSPSALGVWAGDTLRPLSDASTVVASLRDAWMSEVQVHAFANRPDADDDALRALRQQVFARLTLSLQ